MMRSYHFLLLVLAAIATGVSANHKNDCEGPSDAGNFFINFCEEKCVCEETDPGEWAHVCYREREEFTCMSTARRERFLNTYKAVTTPGHPQYALMEELISMHGNSPGIPNFSTIHTPQWFLPWHRYYAMAVEDVLRNEDCRVTLPWWRWSKKSNNWWTGSPFLSASNWLGTNSFGSCVNDGAFAYPAWQPNAGGCLRRNFVNLAMPSNSDINTVLNLPATDFVAFSWTIDWPTHGRPHTRIGGDMGSGLSPREPTFFLHHGYIDQLWDRWQQKSGDHLAAYGDSFPPDAELEVTFGPTPNHVDDHNDLKASGVRYVNIKSTPIGPGHISIFPLCLLVVAKLEKFKLQKQVFWDITKIEDAIANATEAEMRKVPQIRPEVADVDELSREFAWMVSDDATPQQKEEFAVKMNFLAKQLRESAARVENPISQEELERLNNPASVALGLDLDSEEFTKILLEAKVCQEGWDFDDAKGACKKNKKASKELQKRVRKEGKIVGSEVFAKKDAPKPTNAPTPPPTDAPVEKPPQCGTSCLNGIFQCKPSSECTPRCGILCDPDPDCASGCVCEIFTPGAPCDDDEEVEPLPCPNPPCEVRERIDTPIEDIASDPTVGTLP